MFRNNWFDYFVFHWPILFTYSDKNSLTVYVYTKHFIFMFILPGLDQFLLLSDSLSVSVYIGWYVVLSKV